VNVFELVGKLTLDGADKIDGELQKVTSTAEKLQKGLKIAGTAFTAIGVAGLAMISSTKKINAELGQTALTLGISTKEMRNLALSITDVTFPIDSVTKTLDILTKAGMRNTEEIANSALAFDALADATGNSADAVADMLVPAFKVFGIELANAGDEVDKLTWLTKNTTIGLGDFASVMDYVAMYGANLNVTIEDMVGIMAALEAKGMSGAAATRLFRTAVSQAKDGAVTLTEALGLTTDEVDKYKTKLDDATGITKEYADIANTQFTIMDKLKQKWSELTLGASGFLEPLEPILAGMTALGPAMIFLSTSVGLATVKWIAHTVALVAYKIAALAASGATVVLNASLGPIGLAFLALGATLALMIPLLLKTADSALIVNDALVTTSDSVTMADNTLLNAAGITKFGNAATDTGKAIDDFRDKVEEAIGAIDSFNEITEGTKVAIASAQWSVDGYIYRMSLFTKAEVEAARASGKKVDMLTQQDDITKKSTGSLKDYSEQAGKATDQVIDLTKAVGDATSSIEALALAFGTVAGPGGGQYLAGTTIPTYGTYQAQYPAYAGTAEQYYGQYPGLQHGGIATKPMLAMIAEHKPEAVIPLDRMPVGVTITGNNFYVRQESDIDKIAELLIGKIRLKTGVRI